MINKDQRKVTSQSSKERTDDQSIEPKTELDKPKIKIHPYYTK